MAVRKVIQIGHPALKAKNKEVKNFNSPTIKKLIKDLTDTMHKHQLIGIAAPQIAENYKVFATEVRNTKYRKLSKQDKLRIYMNPKIIRTSKEQNVIYEGCGCVGPPHIFGPVKRPKEITIEALDVKGNKFRLRCDGILSRVIQHEFDHTNGIEYLEKVHDYKKLMAEEYYQKIRNSKEQGKASKNSTIEFQKL